MRKIFIILPLLILLFGFRSECANQADVQNLQNAYQTKFGYSLNANNAAQIIDKWQESGVDYLFLMYSENVYHPNELPYSYTRANLVQTFTDTGTAYVWNSSIKSQDFNSSTNTSLTWSSGGSSSSNKNIFIKLKWSDFHTVPIDWDHPYYSVAIPTPEYDVTYRKVGLDVDVPLNFNFNAPLDGDYYVEIMAEFALADYLTFMPISRYFEASSYSYVTKEIVNPIQYVLASDLTSNTLHTVLTNMWQAALNEVPLSSVSIKFPTDFTAQEILDWRDGYEELRETCGTAGTSIKFYARYFQIVDDTKFVVGPWRIWNSVSPKTFNDELPSYYLPYAIASGNTGTSTSTSSDPDDVYIPVGGDNPTGEYYSPSFNITVGNNVPNYPDYPTIASYNMDNLLVSTMNNAKGLTSFFGEFGDFLTMSFSFFPAWIWAIIGVGFSISIVVMFLKIL